jgi:hypothetical protein
LPNLAYILIKTNPVGQKICHAREWQQSYQRLRHKQSRERPLRKKRAKIEVSFDISMKITTFAVRLYPKSETA